MFMRWESFQCFYVDAKKLLNISGSLLQEAIPWFKYLNEKWCLTPRSDRALHMDWYYMIHIIWTIRYRLYHNIVHIQWWYIIWHNLWTTLIFKYLPVSWGNSKQTFSIHFHWFYLNRYWVFERFVDRLQFVLLMMSSQEFRCLVLLPMKVFALYLLCFVPNKTISTLIQPTSKVLKIIMNRCYIQQPSANERPPILTKRCLYNHKICFSLFIFLIWLQRESNLDINNVIFAQTTDFDIIRLLNTTIDRFTIDLIIELER